MSPGSPSFAKLVMTSTAPLQNLRGMPDTRPKIHSFNQRFPIQSRLQSVLGVRSFYVERNKINRAPGNEASDLYPHKNRH